MRQITIDFDKLTIQGLIDNKYAGYLGEHKSTEVVIIKPADLVGASYSVAFQTNGEVYHSEFFADGEEIRVAVWQELTQDNTLYVQLEAYDKSGDYLGKSNVAKLNLGGSVHGVDVVADADNPDVYAEISLNTMFRETLEDNVDTLDKLTTSESGELLFNGKPIEGSTDSSDGGLTEEQAADLALNTEFRKILEDNVNALDKLTVDDEGNLLFNGQPIKAEGVIESANPYATMAQTIALLLESSEIYVSVESPAVASTETSLFANFMLDIVSGSTVLYAPPENGELTYTDVVNYEPVTISVAAGGIYEFYLDMDIYEVKVNSYVGVGILNFFKSKLLTEYVTEKEIDNKIHHALEEGDFVTNEQLNEKLLSVSGLSIEVVDSLPEENINTSTIYLVSSSVNAIKTSLDMFGEDVYNGKGYAENTIYVPAFGEDTEKDGVFITGFIPIVGGDTFTLKNIEYNRDNADCKVYILAYAGATPVTPTADELTTSYEAKWDSEGNLISFRLPTNIGSNKYLRIQASYIGDDSSIVVNEMEDDVYGEYIYVNDKWERIGSTTGDFSGYAKLSDIPAKTSQLTNDSGFIKADNLEFVTPQMFGAVGDGITDDTEAFQSAVDSGKPLFIPSGEYKVGNVYIANPITIKGGNYPRLKFPVEGYRVGEAYKYQPLSIFYCKGGTTEGADGVNGVIIEGIHFDGNCKAICETYYEAEGLISPVLMANVPTHSAGVLIRDRSKNIIIRDCRFDDFKDAAVAIEKCSKQVTVDNCIIGEEGWHGYGYNKGIVASLSQYGGSAEIEDISGYFIFRNNRIFNCGEHGINVYSSYNHCVIEGNFVKDCGLMYDNPDPEIEGGTLTWGYCIKTSGGADLLVANNTCISGMSNGIGLMGDIDHGNKGEMRIIGNHIIGGDDEHSKSSGIQCENVVGVIISDNIIENIHIHAYAGVYAIRTSCGSLISNNIIKNCDRGIGINVYGDTPEYSEASNTHICDNTIIASQPLTLNKLNGANISNNYIKGTEGIDTIVDESVAGIILSDGETVNLNNNILTDLPLGIKATEMKNVVIIETMFSNVDNKYDIDVDTNTNVVVRENKVSSNYELIEEKTITYDDLTVTTSQPSNWATNYKAYCTFDGSSYIPITDSTAPVWEANKYYLNGVQRVNRTFTTDKYSKMILVCSVSDKAPVTNAVYIGFTCDNTSKELYFNSGVTAGEKRYFYASADVSEGLLMPMGSTPKADSTSSNLHGTPTPVPVSSKISRVLIANYGSGLPVGTTISFYGIK